VSVLSSSPPRCHKTSIHSGEEEEEEEKKEKEKEDCIHKRTCREISPPPPLPCFGHLFPCQISQALAPELHKSYGMREIVGRGVRGGQRGSEGGSEKGEKREGVL